MPSVNFYLNRPFAEGSGKFERTKTLNPAETMIFLYVSFPGRKIIKVSSGEKALAKDWDFKKKMFKSQATGSLIFNTKLMHFKAEVLQAITLATTQNPDITLSQLRVIIENTLDGKKPKFTKKSFLDYMDEYLEEKAPLIKYRTLGKFRSFKYVMGEYLDLRGIDRNSFMFESIDHDFAPDFHDYLIHTRKLVNNTISKYFEVVGVIVKWGLRKKYHKNTAFQDFATVPRDKTEIVFLELSEVKAIEALDLSGELDFARTVFLFALYAGGQRLSDIKKLRHKDIVFEADGYVEWRLFQYKGKKTVKNILPLLPQAIEQLKKCYNDRLALTDELVFPLTYEQQLNDNINEICRLAGITEQLNFRHYSGVNLVESGGAKFDFVTMKTARKSFVSIALSLGMSPDLIIQYTGHTTTKVMQKHYLGVSPKFKREALFKFWNQPVEVSESKT